MKFKRRKREELQILIKPDWVINVRHHCVVDCLSKHHCQVGRHDCRFQSDE